MFKTRVDVFRLRCLHRFTITIHKKNAGHLTSLFSKIDVNEKKGQQQLKL